MTVQYPTIADCVGNTPLVRLQRLPGETSNTLLVKLEGNNPAGSVKDRPALSMITRAELRGDIRPGDTLIEATSGNTGIALAMAAAIKGYKMILIMPDNSTAERKAAMTAYGAELILVSKEEGMEGARDLADKLQREGRGKVLDQFANGDNPEAHYHSTGPENMERMGASARIEPMTSMEMGTVQLLVAAMASSRNSGRETGATIKTSPTNTAMMQGCRTSLRKASFLLTLVNRESPAVHMVKRSGIWNMEV